MMRHDADNGMKGAEDCLVVRLRLSPTATVNRLGPACSASFESWKKPKTNRSPTTLP
jgi:hypothetical protein